MPASKFTVVTANLWRENPEVAKDIARLVKTKAHIIGINEGYAFRTLLKAVPGYRYVGERRNPILVREDLKVVGSGTVRLSEAVGESPLRTANFVKLKVDGVRRAVVNMHGNAHVQAGKAKPHRLPRVKEYIRGMVRLRRLVRKLKRQGYVVTVMGDFNWSFTRGKNQWKYAPKVVMGALGLRAQFAVKSSPPRPKRDKRRIEYVFHDPKHDHIAEQRFITPEHSDHPFHLVTYVFRDK